MNSKILYFIGGVVAGSAATFLLLNRRMERRIEEEVEDVKEIYSTVNAGKSLVDGLINDFKNGSEEKDIFEDSESSVDVEESPRDVAIRNAKLKSEMIANSNQIIENNGYANTHKTEYNLFSKPPKAIDIHNGIDEGEDLEIIDTTPSKDAKHPYVLESDKISSASEKFVNEEPYFDKVTLYYFDDGVLCSEEEEIITNVADTIGLDSLNRIGEYEPDVVYVRNERDSTDYEVVRQYRNFADIPENDG